MCLGGSKAPAPAPAPAPAAPPAPPAEVDFSSTSKTKGEQKTTDAAGTKRFRTEIDPMAYAGGERKKANAGLQIPG